MSFVSDLFTTGSSSSTQRLPPTTPTINTGSGASLSVSTPQTVTGTRRVPIPQTREQRENGEPVQFTEIPIVGSDIRNPIVDVDLGGQGLREEALGGARDIRDQVNQDIQTLRGLENPFIQARVRPLMQARDERLASLERGVRRRGGFNSLTENFITGQGAVLDQQISDQRVLATQESQAAIRQAQQVSALLSNQIGEIGQQEIQQAAVELGLGQNAIEQFLASQQVSGTTGSQTASGAEQIGTIASIAGAFMLFCSREWKNVVSEVDGQEALEIVEKLPVVTFTYRDDVKNAPGHPLLPEGRHISTFAEDFNQKVFGEPAQYINVMDYIGVLHGAIKGLTQRLNELEAKDA